VVDVSDLLPDPAGYAELLEQLKARVRASQACSSSRSAARSDSPRWSNMYGLAPAAAPARSPAPAVRWRSSTAPTRPANPSDLTGQHVSGPAVLACSRGVPVPPLAAAEPVEQHHYVAPGQSCSGLLHKVVRPHLGQRPHVVQVPAALVRELGPQGGGGPVDDPAAPAGLLLPVQDFGLFTKHGVAGP